MAFFRKKLQIKIIHSTFLLNSDLKNLYAADGLKAQKDELCVGVMAYNVKNFQKFSRLVL